ncbi:MAG: HyaD/HybD family hydrogenase maturation endopeptidase [Gemmatimonadaceae bacterium]|nr:HyaD/HybD family hydrogenase maturation endopeptidase [Gemmatimonadaceae bacterium]
MIGLGNPLLADDGLGLEIVGRLARAYDCGPDVELEDGGTWGMNLLPMIEQAERVLFIDAIRTGAAPGTVQRLDGDAIPRQLGLKLSPHQMDLQDLVAVATLRGTFPSVAVAIGVEPEVIETRTGLSSSVSARIDDVLDAVVDQLKAWGHDVVIRPYLPPSAPFPTRGRD